MSGASLGGGTSAVAASAHAGCARFRGTDPLVTGRTRKALAAEIGFPDDSARIPEARWARAMTFESLVRGPRFASEVATTTVGRLGLARPTEVVTADAQEDVDRTAELLEAAHARARTGAATLIYALAVPFTGFEQEDATAVKPDFAVVAGDWLILGDAKDYERVRSRIEDTRLLKGFLQVALAAESAATWSRLPKGMKVHDHGVLAAPRNAFLQPEALVELLDDHRDEVRMRVAERRAQEGGDVATLNADYDPARCTTCSFFSYCRHELRTSEDPADLLIELGIPVDQSRAKASVQANIAATLDGVARTTGQRRIDQAGRPGTVDVALVKSDAAALGVHGVAIRSHPGEWELTTFDDPQSADTRRTVMELLGAELAVAMAAYHPVHLVVPDTSTVDVLASIADNLAGIELSRLRWEHDFAMGRETLTFHGEPAQLPAPLTSDARLAVSFLLEQDRARALTLRSPVIDVRAALARHLVAGGPAVASLRLDYLVAWVGPDAVDARKVEDEIESCDHTPGARLTNRQSDAIHRALAGTRSRPADLARYAELVTDELRYTCDVLDQALDALDAVPDSTLREVHRAIEADSQAVWRRRLALHASDLVRFGRTHRYWRNALVPVVESDGLCHDQLLVLANPQAALDRAADAGVRQIAEATVVHEDPLMVEVASRRIGDCARIVLLHVDGRACVEEPGVEVKHQKSGFSFSGLSIGPLSATDVPRRFQWASTRALAVGQRLIVADFTWFSKTAKRDTVLPVARPKPDEQSAPKETCTRASYADDPETHAHCCRPHEDAEAEWADLLAQRRAGGELNPQVWPPVVDGDAFEVVAEGTPVGDATAEPSVPAPEYVTLDDLE